MKAIQCFDGDGRPPKSRKTTVLNRPAPRRGRVRIGWYLVHFEFGVTKNGGFGCVEYAYANKPGSGYGRCNGGLVAGVKNESGLPAFDIPIYFLTKDGCHFRDNLTRGDVVELLRRVLPKDR